MASSVKWFNTITLLSLCVMIFTLPFSKSMVEICFIVAFISWILNRALSYKSHTSSINLFRPISTKLNLPICFFAFTGLLSTLMSVSLSLSIKGFFFKLLEWLILYFIIVEVVNDAKKLNRVLIVIFFSMAVISLNAIYQIIAGVDFIRHYPILASKVQSSFGNPNGFAGWLTIMIPLALSLSCFKNTVFFSLSRKYFCIEKFIAWVLVSVLIFCLVLTHSKGAWTAFFLSTIFLAIFNKSSRLPIIIVLTLSVLTVFFLFYINGYINYSIKLSGVIRTALWVEALSIIKDFPLFGCGLNTYSIVAPNYKIIELGGIYPHNSYLQMASETGLLGLGAFIWIIIALYKISLENLKKINSRFYGIILIGMLAGLAGLLMHSFVDTDMYSLQLGNLMWIFLGLIVATQKIALEDKIISMEPYSV